MKATLDKIKLEIAQNYCTSLAVIDDDAVSDANYGSIGENFQGLAQECAKLGILCHFQYYPKAQGGPDSDDFKEHFACSLNVAKNAGVIILDWYLGNDNDGPEHAIKILEEISNSPELRFVFIYSNHPEEVPDKLKSMGFTELEGQRLHETIEEQTEPEIETGAKKPAVVKNDIFIKDNKLFIQISPKNEVPGKEVVQKVLNMLTTAFTDLFQWAGLEMGYRISKIIPRILPTLPKNVDKELVIQYIFKILPNEFSDQFTGLIIDEIKREFMNKHLRIIGDDVLEEEAKLQLKSFGDDIDKIKKEIKRITEDAGKNNNQRNLHENLGASIESLHNLNSFVESYRLPSNSLYLSQGGILSKDNKYLLCVIPLCDLYRIKKNGNIAFIVGSSTSGDIQASGGQKFVQTNVIQDNQFIVIKWDLSDVYQINAPEKIEGYPTLGSDMLKNYKFVGQLREDITNRIIQRMWSYRTRVGTDIHEIVRIMRNEQ